MSNLMKYRNYFGSIEISLDDDCLYGKLECINDVITYEAKTPSELKTAFEDAVDDYLVTCEAIGKDPDRTMSGTFNVRIGPDLHKKAYLAAKSRKITLNEFIKISVDNSLSDRKEFHIHIDKTHEVSDFSFGPTRRRQEKSAWVGTFDGRLNH